MTDAWTPGPWSASLGNLPRVFARGGDVVAGVHRLRLHAGKFDPIEVAGNARLIAAAPELAAVADGAMVYVIEDEDAVRLKIGGVEICAVAGDSAAATQLIKFDAERRAALAKARGQDA